MGTVVITTSGECEAFMKLLDATHKAAQADDYATERAKRPKRMTCTCCGQTYKGRQWWNQDTGYGLGDCCVKFCNVDPAGGENSCYGVPGIHFLIEQEKSEE